MEKTLFIFTFYSVLISFSCLSSAQSPCKTPNRKEGVCVFVRDCKKLSDMIINYRNLSPSDQEFVRKSRCSSTGVTIKVCCEIPTLKESDFPPPGTCGTQLKERIVGGEETTIQDYPWLALIQYTLAAHCVSPRRLAAIGGWKPTTVRLGEHNLQTDEDCEDIGSCADPVIDLDINKIILHELYESSHYNIHDIALVRLSRSVIFTDWVRPICLPFAVYLRNKVYDDIRLSVAGFGRTENGTASDVKLKVEIDGYNWNRCNYKYGRTLIQSQLCAGGKGDKDSCGGDSGGPLMGDDFTNSNLPITYLAGIVSKGPSACGRDGYPAIYTRVDHYLDWIMEHMNP